MREREKIGLLDAAGIAVGFAGIHHWRAKGGMYGRNAGPNRLSFRSTRVVTDTLQMVLAPVDGIGMTAGAAPDVVAEAEHPFDDDWTPTPHVHCKGPSQHLIA